MAFRRSDPAPFNFQPLDIWASEAYGTGRYQEGFYGESVPVYFYVTNQDNVCLLYTSTTVAPPARPPNTTTRPHVVLLFVIVCFDPFTPCDAPSAVRRTFWFTYKKVQPTQESGMHPNQALDDQLMDVLHRRSHVLSSHDQTDAALRRPLSDGDDVDPMLAQRAEDCLLYTSRCV